MNPASGQNSRDIVVTTGNDVAGATITGYLGVVRGVVVRSPNIAASIMGGLQSLGGGRIAQYEEVCEDTRHQAYTLMVKHAQELSADGIIAMRYDAAAFGRAAATEVLAYGTAVKLHWNS